MLSKVTNATDAIFYEWDDENRLLGVDTDGDGTNDVEYAYDADGVLVSRTEGGQETRFLNDTNIPLSQVALEYTPGGIIQASYVFGRNLISQDRGGTKSYYHGDAINSTRFVTDASENVTDRIIYDAYGRVLSRTGSTVLPFLYTGERQDLVTDLSYLRARHYAPGIGRFLSTDPFAGLTSSPVSLHRYLYGNANPVTFTDPSGNFSLISISFAFSIQTTLQVATARAGIKTLKRATRIADKLLQPAAKIEDVGISMILNDVRVPGRPDGFQIYLIGRQMTSLAYRALSGVIIGFYKEIAESLATAFLPPVVGIFEFATGIDITPIYEIDPLLDNFIAAVQNFANSQGLEDLVKEGEGNIEAESNAVFMAADGLLLVLGLL